MDQIQTAPGGLAGWLLQCFGMLRVRIQRASSASAPELSVVETISLGGRRQLTLVRCGSEQFLVGCGADQVQTIVRVAGSGDVCR